MLYVTDIKVNVGGIRIRMKPAKGIGLLDVYLAARESGVSMTDMWSMDQSGCVKGEVEDVAIHPLRRSTDYVEPGAAVIIALQGIGCNTVSVSELTQV